MISKKTLGINVIQAAQQRIIDAFSQNCPVWLSFSGGKDSLVLASILYDLAERGKIDVSRLTVIFIDEEAMFDDIINIVKQWRIKFIQIGAKFEWYCLQVKHYNCLNSLSEEETFICWDSAKKDVWVREMPPFAITDDEWLIPYKDNYQAFLTRKCNAYGAISMRGVRVAESVQRYQFIATMKNQKTSLPIYDMTDKDVWLYLLRYNVEYPKVYENLYSVGVSKRNLRISQFFSIDTARALVKLGEMYPDLMERVTRREPNAYLCAMYWDTEMFGRSTRRRRELEKGNEDNKDYKQLVRDFFDHPENYPNPVLASNFKRAILRNRGNMRDDDWKKIYEIIINGDPKQRSRRAFEFGLTGREAE